MKGGALNLKGEIMCNQESLDTLINAHRALAARQEALFQISKVMFALIPDGSGLKRRLLASANDAIQMHMQNAGHDQEYKQLVQSSMDELRQILLLADNSPALPS